MAKKDPKWMPDGESKCPKCGSLHWLTRKPACRAHNKHGGPCGRPPIVGGVTCTTHGGTSKVVRDAGKRRAHRAFIEGKVAQLLEECDMPAQHPLDGLLEVVRHSGAMMRLLAGLVGELAVHPSEATESWSMGEDGELIIRKEGALYGPNHLGDAEPSILVELYGLWSDRYAKACKLALDANIDERLVRNAESTSEVLFSAIGRAIDAAGLNTKQKTALRATLATELRRVAGPVELEISGA